MKAIVERVAEEKHCLRGTLVTDGWMVDEISSKTASIILKTW